MPTEVQGSNDRVQRYLQRSVSFAVTAPLAESDEVKLLGARLTLVRGEPAVLYQYRVGAQRISVLQTATGQRTQAPPRPGARPQARTRTRTRHAVHHRDGYAVVTYVARGVTHAVVSAMPERELVRLVPAELPIR